jgi:3-hydroxyisobutyrate dehydrogenase-like beta-hydroxyacid dehydrogenase
MTTLAFLGPQGSGALFKLAANAFLGIQTAALGELLGFMLRAGLDRETVVMLFPELPVMSPAGKGFFALMAAEDHAPRFALDLMRRDLRYAGDAVPGLALPLTEAARQAFDRASAAGLGAANLTAVAKLSR